ncbi:hypothetical protein NL328_27375, partial [Klebsiella pneumoniae]|nr:hypothetical protein [Klebsiella pneumoniae]
MDAVHGRQVLSRIAILLVTLFVQEHASRVAAFLVLEPSRAVFGRAMLGLENPVTVLGTVDGLNATCRFFGALKRHVNAERLV